MQNIQNKIIQNYTNNLKFLQKSDTKLLDRINLLSNLIDTKDYKERFQLEYIKEENGFDIYDSATNSYIYNKEPSTYNKQVITSVSLNTKNSFNLLKESQYNNNKKAENSNELSTIEKLDNNLHNDIFEYTEVFNNPSPENKEFKSIDKFVFIGTLLGSHIPQIHQNLKSFIYFISDNNLEIFRLSLFVTDYSKIAINSQIVFSIMDDKQDFINKFKLYLSKEYESNYMIKYHSTNYNIHDYFDRIAISISQYTPFRFSYPYILHNLLDKSFININNYNVLNTKNRYTILNNMPVLLLAAGPSLSKNIKWIKENEKKFFIVAIGATIIKLCKYDIIPNIIVSADSKELIGEQFPDYLLERIKNIPFLASTMTHPSVLKKFNKSSITLFETMTAIKDTSKKIDGASVGELAFYLSIILGANDIYMLGTDLALDPDTGNTHEDSYISNTKFNLDNIEPEYNSFKKSGILSYRSTTLLIKGNFRDKVISTTSFAKSIFAYNSIINNFQNLNIYNLSDGAYLENTISKKVSEINMLNNIEFNIKPYINKLSSKGLTNNEQENIKKSIELIDLINIELNKIKNIKVKTYIDFIKQRKPVLELLISKTKIFDNLYLHSLIANYILITEPYIYYSFNSVIKNEANLIKKAKKIWINQIKKICMQYKDIVNKSIN